MEIPWKESMYVCLSMTETVSFIFVTGQGNIALATDYNWHCDPEAAHAVLAGLNTVITLLPKEICRESSFSWVCNICSAVQFAGVWHSIVQCGSSVLDKLEIHVI